MWIELRPQCRQSCVCELRLQLRVNGELPDPTVRILTYCEFGKISTLAAATLRELGYGRAVALDGGFKAWREAGFPLET